MDKNSLNEIWKDQADFNLNFFPQAHTFEDRTAQTKEFALCIMGECDELLRHVPWKIHRKTDSLPNYDGIKNELSDIFKYWISLCLVWGISPEEALRDYWRKSMVCRQRFSEEFMLDLNEEVVVIDIDGVLANYPKGFLTWVRDHYPQLADQCNELLKQDNVWIDYTSLDMHPQFWQEVKHAYRTQRGKLDIETYPDVAGFMKFCQDLDCKIVLLTSRPIDKYPNIYVDTLEWLKNNEIPFDYIWWSTDKIERLLEKNVIKNIRFAVDDDPKYVHAYARYGIPCYRVSRSSLKYHYVYETDNGKKVHQVKTLNAIVEHNKKEATK